ncbi:MAG: hypothetical protein IJT32_06790, partial [Lachnospiraceae bacterium]|nr:hypothetical protein [Lachnospiraceae bacterium]
ALKKARVPILVLDQKWHRLFAISGKPENIKALEVSVNELLAAQGKINEELKTLKKVKSNLMKSVMENMQGAEQIDQTSAEVKNLDDTKRLLDETNERIEADNDALLDAQEQLAEANTSLMIATMQFTYSKLRTNSNEIRDISEWIADVRVKLKKNLIKKQNREINNKEIYGYMHDIFGKEVVELFDVRYDEEGKLIIGEAKEGTT